MTINQYASKPIPAAQFAIPVSVIIPLYGRVEFLSRAIDSIASQSMQPCEVIIINDGGGDSVDGILQKLSKHYEALGFKWFKWISILENQGVSAARNIGWDRATGRYIAFLDADDAWHPKKLEIQFQYMENNQELILSGHAHFADCKVLNWDSILFAFESCEISTFKLLLSNQFITPSVMIRNSIKFRFDVKRRYMEDYDLWLRLKTFGYRISKIEYPLACTFKPSYGYQGLSSHLVKMEIGELNAYLNFFKSNFFLAYLLPFFFLYSILKFFRRLFLSHSYHISH